MGLQTVKELTANPAPMMTGAPMTGVMEVMVEVMTMSTADPLFVLTTVRLSSRGSERPNQSGPARPADRAEDMDELLVVSQRQAHASFGGFGLPHLLSLPAPCQCCPTLPNRD